MISGIKKILLYAGLDKDEYEAINADITRQNHAQLVLCSTVAACILLVLAVSSLFGDGFGAQNRFVYLAALLVCGFVTMAARRVDAAEGRWTGVLFALFEALLYVLGFAVSLLHKDYPAVTEIAFLLIVPQIITDRPLYSGIKTFSIAVLFCLLSSRIKAPDVAWADIYNTAVFAVAAFTLDILITRMKVKAICQERRIVYMSETDVMTGLKNRNSYEYTLQELPKLCKNSVLCIYGDVNGLHELNNTQGHDAGDRMLKTTADAMKKHFGTEHLYRIGGDEFVSLQIDKQVNTQAAIERVMSEISSSGYHMSFGISSHSREELDVAALIRSAEEMMYREKEAYYEASGLVHR